LSSTTEIVGSAAPAGTVVSQSPGAGTQTLPGSAVALQVSNGVAPISIVPDVIGLTLEDASARLRAAGFGVVVQEQAFRNDNNHGIVVAQSPRGGTELLEGRSVTITVGVPIAGGGGGGQGSGDQGGGGGNQGGGNQGGGGGNN
jgi:eukaryotic-like serine/threonine-protein kinase